MKKSLIIAQGTVARHFISRVAELHSSDNFYDIVCSSHERPPSIKTDNIKFFNIDPTSYLKLSQIYTNDITQVIVVMDYRKEAIYSIENIRRLSKNLQILVLDKWDLEIDDPHTMLISSNDFLANRMVDYLPDVPVIAQNVGLGEGEIMEVLVPFGSSYVYRRVSSISQNDWHISAIYRSNQLLLITKERLILPNDLLLLVGKPSVLKMIYRSIKRELGQFPAPYGHNLYLYIDMSREKETDIYNLVRRAIYVHTRFHHKLIIKIDNPTDISVLQGIKAYSNYEINIDINFSKRSVGQFLLSDVSMHKVGLIMISSVMFSDFNLRNILYQTNVPVLSIAKNSLIDVDSAALMINNPAQTEYISTTVFDLSSQLNLHLKIYNDTAESSKESDEVIEHYRNLSTIFSKSIKIINHEQNPIRLLRTQKNFLHCLPFNHKVLQKRYSSIFSTDSDELYYKLNNFHQIFIPVTI